MNDFDFEAQDILNDCAEAFTESSLNEIMKPKIIEAREKIKILRTSLEIAKNASTGSSSRKNLTPHMKMAYSTIMGMRSFLLGSQEHINYRLYIRNGDISNVRIVDIPEDQLMKIVERSGNTLRLKRTLDNIASSYNNSETQKLFDQHFANIKRSLKFHGGNNFLVPVGRISDLVSGPEGVGNLYWQTDSTRGKSAYTPKLFNRGWIYQAFDATVNSLYKKDEDFESVSSQSFRHEYFLNQLKYDNLVGFKGGDVGLNQIKSNMASLMNITTLIDYLKILEEILMVENYSNKAELKQKILTSFTENTNLSEMLTQRVEQVVDDLFAGFNNNT